MWLQAYVSVKSRRFATLAALASFVVLAGACARDAPLDSLRPAGPIARQIDGLWDVVFAAAVIVFVLVEGLFVIAMIRFRHRKGDDSEPTQTHGNTPLELGWTIAPAVVLAVLAVPTVLTIFALARDRPNQLTVEVTGQQWWWGYDYGDERVVTANELHIPAGRPIRLALHSNDIIHSFWVPRLGGKQDVVPGRVNHVTIQADRPGEYDGTCTEYCGLSHANMRLKVFAHTPADFEQWLEDQREDAVRPRSAMARRGERIFQTKQCVTCHTVRFDGSKAEGTIGPDLTHFASRGTFAGSIFERTDGNLRKWLIDAPAAKPGSKMPAGIAEMGLTEEDVTALVAYLQGLR
jgi:cytochrome c oxidase subunit 2